MEEKLQKLESENARLTEALCAIAEHQREIDKLLDGVKDIIEKQEDAQNAPVTDEAVVNLLKKYSRL